MKVVLLAILLLAVGCADEDDPDAQADGVVDATTDDHPDCPEPGEVLTEEAAEACMDDGEIQMLGVHDCGDGRGLWAEDDMWAWVGEEVRQTDEAAAASDEYRQAYEDCTG